ncbi:MAG: hypothetical protein ABSH12_03705 [Endomicrobiales bacterium]|jgi:spermidine synthase
MHIRLDFTVKINALPFCLNTNLVYYSGMRKFSIALIFGFSGCISVISQTLLFREMLVAFQGNELSIGILLSSWLLGTTAGSWLGGRFKKKVSPAAGLRNPLIVAAILLPIVFFAVRFARPLVSTIPGMGLSLGTLFGFSLMLFVPLSMTFGFQFGCTRHIKTAFLFEAAGYLAGGLIFTYLMLPLDNAVMMLLCVCLSTALFTLIMNLVSAMPDTRWGTLISTVLIIVLPGFFLLAQSIDTATLSRGEYPGCTIVASHYSPYGHTVIAERNAERYVFSNGIPLTSFPDDDAVFSESFAYIPYLFHHHPKTVLVIGSAAPILSYLEREPIEKITYIENDSFLAKSLNPTFGAVITDARTFLSSSPLERFDLIYINLPYPTSASLNRYYTVEFFLIAKRALNQSGVIAFKAPGSLVYLDPIMTGLNYSLWATAHAVFSDVRIVPGDDNIFIASSTPLPPPGIVARRMKRLVGKTSFLSVAYLLFTFNSEKTAWLYDQFNAFREKNYRNNDFMPHGLMQGLLYWQSVFAPGTTGIYSMFTRYAWIVLVVLLLWLMNDRVGINGTAFSSGAAAMGLYMATIWSLQVAHGSLYYWIGMATALFMAGTALGAWAIRIPWFQPSILVTEILFTVWIITGCLALARPLPLAGFGLFAAGSGFLLGYQFPLLASRTGVAAYTADAIGAGTAALIFGTIIIPAWGIPNTLLVILAVKLITLQWWLTE